LRPDPSEVDIHLSVNTERWGNDMQKLIIVSDASKRQRLAML